MQSTMIKSRSQYIGFYAESFQPPDATAKTDEWEKMLRGEEYIPWDPYIAARQAQAAAQLQKLQEAQDFDSKWQVIKQFFTVDGSDTRVLVRPGFSCEYGENIHCHGPVFINFNVTIMDSAQVHIGPYTAIGPCTQIYTLSHPTNFLARKHTNICRQIHIGSHVTIGGGAILLPGVKIGDGATVGAGSVVTTDIPAWSVAVGNPARVVKVYHENCGIGSTGVAVRPDMTWEAVCREVERPHEVENTK